MPKLFNGMTAEEFLKHSSKTMKRGRPSAEMQKMLNEAREVVAADKAKAAQQASDPTHILTAVGRQFEILKLAGQKIVKGQFNSLVVSGSAGIGKTHTLDSEVFGPAAKRGHIQYRKVSGHTSALELIKLLYAHRFNNCVLLLDDNDGIFSDETALNILKAALDSHPIRRVSWLSATNELEEEEKDFAFAGHVAFITNVNLIAEIERGGAYAEHLEAFRSRSHYLDLGLHNKHSKALWTAHIVRKYDVVVKEKGVTKEQQEAIVNYIVENFATSSDISIRAAINMGDYVGMVDDLSSVKSWKEIAKAFGY